MEFNKIVLGCNGVGDDSSHFFVYYTSLTKADDLLCVWSLIISSIYPIREELSVSGFMFAFLFPPQPLLKFTPGI